MNTISEEKIAAIRREKQGLGVLYGLLAGIGFAVTAWGLDATQLAQANAYLPWGKFVAGLIGCLILGGLAGWLTTHLDSSLWAVLIWFLVGSAIAVGTAWLTYQGFVHLFDWFYPALAGKLSYTLNPAIQIRTGIAALVSGLVGIAVGLSQINQVDSALAGIYPLQRLVSLSVGVIIFGIAGLITNGLVQANLREPVIQLNNALVYAQEHRGETIEIHEARQHGQTAVRTLGELQFQPYRLVVSSFDEYLSMIWVMIDFRELQTRCAVLEQNLTYCEAQPGVTKSSVSRQTQSRPTITNSGAPTAIQTKNPSSPTATPNNPANPGDKPALLPDQVSDLHTVLNRYQLQVTLEPEQHRFQGRLHLDYTNSENTPLDKLFFRLLPNGQRSYGDGSLIVDWVKVDDQDTPSTLSLEDTILEVPLGKTLIPGESVRVTMDFQGQVPLNFGGGEQAAGYGIYNYSEEVLTLASWYPILAVYDAQGWHLNPVSYIGDSVFSDMAIYQVEIELPEDNILISTGVTQSVTPTGDFQRYIVESGPVRDFFMILSPRFAKVQAQVAGTLVSSYYLPDHAAGGQRALDVAIQSLEVFNTKFGPYPYTELDVVDAPMQNASGVEYPGIILVGDSLYPEYDQTGFLVTTAHEVAHQWWYNLVGNDVFAEPWLDEALASYASGLYLEATQGKPALEGLMSYYQERYQRSLDRSGDHPISSSLAYFENNSGPNAYGGIVYAKGALFLDAVRREIGDKAFFTALQRYFQEYRYRIASGADLLNAFETAVDRPLDDLYQTWGATSQR